MSVKPFRGPIETPIVNPRTGILTFGWQQHLLLTAQQLKTPANQTPPIKSSDPGEFGQIALDPAGNFYVHVGTKWMRVKLLDF